MQVFFTRLICTLILGSAVLPLSAQLTPEFTSNKNSGCAPFSLVVSFQDATTGNPTSWLWKFGDSGNSSSTLQNPTFIYSNAGCYDVTLIVSDGTLTDSITKTCFIEVFPQPQPGFTVDVSEGCAPLTVNFTDTSVANSASITSWTYILSDGSNDTIQNPTFTFSSAPDTINVALSVTNSNGCQNTLLFTDVIQVAEPPILDFAPDTNAACTGPLAITFTNNSQFNGASNPIFEWDFPGGTPANFTGTNPPVVTYNADGQYDVTLRVSSANGCADTLFQAALIGIGGVTANYTASNTTICLGDTITFTNTSLGGVSTIEWDFGETAGIDGTSNIETYVYGATGQYTVTLSANNIDCGDTLVQTNLITVEPVPTASFTIDRDIDCQTGLPFFFTDASAGATGWSWDFGDTNTSSQQNPQHTYTAFGDYIVCLTVTNAQGCTHETCDTISVQPPQVLFTRTPFEGCAPIQTQYTENSNSIDPIVGYSWDFGVGAVPPTSVLQNPLVDYPNPGTYNTTLTITTQNGCVGSATLTPAVEVGVPPVSTFVPENDSVCINEAISFIADSANPGWDYLWDFQYEAPGNFFEFDDSVTTAYPDSGVYSVALIVDNNGCQDTTILQDIVFVSPPLANFTASDTIVCELPTTLTFTDGSIGPADVFEWYVDNTLFATGQGTQTYTISATGNYLFSQVLLNSLTGCTDTFNVLVIAGNPIADFDLDNLFGCRELTVTATNNSQNAQFFAWDFDLGDAIPSNSTLVNPTYTYADTGIYSVRLATQDQIGCRDTLVRTAYVEVVGPYANFGATPITGCPPLVVSFTDSTATTAATTPVTWLWDFGDGTTGAGPNPTHQYDSAGNYPVLLTVTDDQGCMDSLRIDSFIQVTFPVPAFIVDDDSTCSGDTVQFTNLSTGVGMTYLWDFGDGTTDTVQDPAHLFVKPVDDTVAFSYDVKLIVTDINGCVDSLTLTDFIYLEPFDARFNGDPTVGICPPLSTQFFDQSIGNVAGWNWNFGNGIGVSSLQNPANLYLTPGNFDVELIATHENGCMDTLLREDFIQLAGPNGSYVMTPAQICLGDTMEITAIVTAADCGAFDFRDGVVVDTCAFTGGTDTISVEHIYGNAGIYFPILVLEDAQGCVFTLDNGDSAIVNVNPTARLLPADTAGCSPFPVAFLDGTILGDTTIANWQWVFGDGDSSFIQNPIHTFSGDTVVTVELWVEDVFGCVDSTSTPLTVYDGAIAGFMADQTIGCSPLDITFTDQTTNLPASGWTWIFGDGDTLTGVSNPTHNYTNDGLYTVTLIIGDTLGCTDTLVREDYINLRHPAAVLYSDVTSGCNPLTITFFADSTVTDTGIVQYDWCLTNITTGVVTCNTTGRGIDSLSLNFNDAGDYEMVLTVTGELGCTDISDPLQLNIVPRVVPDPLTMLAVSVVDPSAVAVIWAPYPGTDFMEYAIYRTDISPAVLVGTVTDQAQTNFIHTDMSLDTEMESYCYKVLVQNSCLEYSELDATEEHCTIELETAQGTDAIILNWTPYVGFEVGTYEVYRTNTYDLSVPPQLIATLPGLELTYTDRETFCRDSISYRILGIGFGSVEERSYSDIDRNAPFHPDPVLSSDMVVATVEADSFISLSWTPYVGYLPEYYALERSFDGNDYILLDSLPLTILSAIDTTVMVDAQSYYYRVWGVDECGDSSVLGRNARSIFLEIDLDSRGKVPMLRWNPYETWANGVLSYTVEVFNEADGIWETVDLTPGNSTGFDDNQTVLNQATYCYRVLASEVGGFGALSVSNEQCVTFGPTLFVPNAFTPNNDGKNDRFRVIVPNAEFAELTIFNRWGDLIYTTEDMDRGWDGTFRGTPVQEGAYVFRIEGRGVDGTNFDRTGTVTLYR